MRPGDIHQDDWEIRARDEANLDSEMGGAAGVVIVVLAGGITGLGLAVLWLWAAIA